MADTTLGADSARENPNNAFVHARAVFEMARADCLECGDSDEEITLCGGSQCGAADALLLTPAPDIAALAYKLEVFRDEEAYNQIEKYREPVLAALIADAHRLATEARQ